MCRQTEDPHNSAAGLLSNTGHTMMARPRHASLTFLANQVIYGAAGTGQCTHTHTLHTHTHPANTPHTHIAHTHTHLHTTHTHSTHTHTLTHHTHT